MSTLVLFLCEDETAASEMRVALLKGQQQSAIELEDSVVVTHDRQGRIELDQLVSLTRARDVGARFWGMLVELVFAPAPRVSGAGGVMEAATGSVVGDAATENLKLSFEPGASALCILVRTATVAAVLEALGTFAGRARVFQTVLTKDQEDGRQPPPDLLQMRQIPWLLRTSEDGLSSLWAPLQPPHRFLRDAVFPVMWAAWREYERDYAHYYAIAVVYYALITLVPLLLLILAVLGLLLQHSEVAAAAERQLLSTIDANLGPEFGSHIERAFQMLRQDSPITTAVSLGGLLITVAALFKHLRLTFSALWKQAPPLAGATVRQSIRAVLREGGIAFLMVFAGGALLGVAFGLLTFAQWAAAIISRLPVLGPHAAWLLVQVPPVLIAPASFALLFRYLPPQRLPWRDVALASVLCGVGWLLGAELLTWYGRIVRAAPSAYGTLGGLLLVMLWMKVVSQMLFFGAEICKVAWSTDRMRRPTMRVTDAP